MGYNCLESDRGAGGKWQGPKGGGKLLLVLLRMMMMMMMMMIMMSKMSTYVFMKH